MSQRPSFAIGTGLFIVLGFTALAYLATQTTSVANTTRALYTIDARFANVGQLKERAPVRSPACVWARCSRSRSILPRKRLT